MKAPYNMKRRTFLTSAAVASLPVAAVTVPVPKTPRERLDAAIAELKAAAEAYNPSICHWKTSVDGDGCKIMMAAFDF